MTSAFPFDQCLTRTAAQLAYSKSIGIEPNQVIVAFESVESCSAVLDLPVKTIPRRDLHRAVRRIHLAGEIWNLIKNNLWLPVPMIMESITPDFHQSREGAVAKGYTEADVSHVANTLLHNIDAIADALSSLTDQVRATYLDAA
jgi:hypothetical protein